GPLVAAAAALVIQSAIDAAAEAVQSRVEALKQSSVASYSGVLIMDNAGVIGLGPANSIDQWLLLMPIIKLNEEFQRGSAVLVGIIPRGTSSETDGRRRFFHHCMFMSKTPRR